MVAGALGEAQQLAGWRPDRIDDHMGPHQRAVLADPPALGLKPPFGFAMSKV
jgi:hypothetical protein